MPQEMESVNGEGRQIQNGLGFDNIRDPLVSGGGNPPLNGLRPKPLVAGVNEFVSGVVIGAGIKVFV